MLSWIFNQLNIILGNHCAEDKCEGIVVVMDVQLRWKPQWLRLVELHMNAIGMKEKRASAQ